MTAITFDTYKFIQTLQDADFSRQQAEGISHAFKDAQHESEVATKADIRELRAEMREMGLRLTIRIGAMIATAIVVIVAMDRFLRIPVA